MDQLPNFILEKIALELPGLSCLKFFVNKKLEKIFQDQNFWLLKLQKDFGIETKQEKTWKDEYLVQYLRYELYNFELMGYHMDYHIRNSNLYRLRYMIDQVKKKRELDIITVSFISTLVWGILASSNEEYKNLIKHSNKSLKSDIIVSAMVLIFLSTYKNLKNS